MHGKHVLASMHVPHICCSVSIRLLASLKQKGCTSYPMMPLSGLLPSLVHWILSLTAELRFRACRGSIRPSNWYGTLVEVPDPASLTPYPHVCFKTRQAYSESRHTFTFENKFTHLLPKYVSLQCLCVLGILTSNIQLPASSF